MDIYMRKTNSFPFSFACICCGGARAGAGAGGGGGAFTLNAYDVMCYIIYIYILLIQSNVFLFFFRQILVVSHDILYTLVVVCIVNLSI